MSLHLSSRRRAPAAVALLVVSLAVASCEGDAAGLDEDEVECVAGATRCAGPAVEVCGPDGLRWAPVAECDPPGVCAAGVCCEPSCEQATCGPDGCGGSCGTCSVGLTCVGGACLCVGDCEGKECGDDGCGTTCGSCNDGNLCTEDSCQADFTCTHAATVDCTSADPCFIGDCLPESGCAYAPKSGPCDDGDPCTDADTCVDGACTGVAADCSDGDACTLDICDVGQAGCTHAPISCDDGNPCTDSACGPDVGCLFGPLAGACSDGDPCTVDDSCAADGACVGVPLDCDDHDECTEDVCVQGMGCTHTAIECDDSDACTIDTCDAHTGCAYESVDCGDGSSCTSDWCDAALGCQHGFAGTVLAAHSFSGDAPVAELLALPLNDWDEVATRVPLAGVGLPAEVAHVEAIASAAKQYLLRIYEDAGAKPGELLWEQSFAGTGGLQVIQLDYPIPIAPGSSALWVGFRPTQAEAFVYADLDGAATSNMLYWCDSNLQGECWGSWSWVDLTGLEIPFSLAGDLVAGLGVCP